MPATKRPALSRERVLDAALAVLDREGIDALSMRRIGQDLGVEAMSLYNHVPSKAALLDGLHERILEEMEPPATARSWTSYARHQAQALRTVLLRHPRAVPLFASRPAATQASLERLEAYLAVLRGAGFRALDALEIVQCLSAFVVGHSLWTVREPGDSTAPDYASLEAARFPNVRAAAAVLAKYDPEAEFARGLDALLAGFAPEAKAPRKKA